MADLHRVTLGAMPRCVFVYGTLRRGQANDINQLQPAPRFVGPAVLAGTLFDLGDYPGLVLPGSVSDLPVGEVVGEVYAIESALEQRLDTIEGLLPQDSGEYAKRDCDVRVAGKLLRCLVYEINPRRLTAARLINGCDWSARTSK
ncbi:MAG: gamma-glutamylcyclotransferase [Burkholderiaceae bacterium]